MCSHKFSFSDVTLPGMRTWFVFAFDLCAVALAWVGAFWLRFNFSLPASVWAEGWAALVWLLPLYAVLFRIFGLYRGLWVFASLPDLLRIAKALLVGTLATGLAVVFLPQCAGIPHSVVLLTPILLGLLMGGARASYRIWKEYHLFGGLMAQGKPVLILGAGTTGANLVKELQRSAEWRVVGLLDDADAKQGREILGLKVLGELADLSRIVVQHSVRHAIIAMPRANHEARHRAMQACSRAGVKALTVPAFDDLIQGRIEVSQLRNVEVEDLLGRDPVVLDTPQVSAMLAGKTVMVTGGGGSIGSELCRQIARFTPHFLLVYEQSEFALYRLTEEFSRLFPEVSLIPISGDVKDKALLMSVMQQYRPSAVFHAAAYKHVPLMEERNAWQAVRNNVYGTWQVAEAALACGVERFVLISTDKAINPTNVMGATKRLAEMVCQALQIRANAAAHATRFEVVRFGNVLGSSGSVIPKFQEQITQGGPVTVTHPEITRYFMSITEAAQLVLQAASMGLGGEIFVLDMGEPVRIADLARDMIRLSGADEQRIKIIFTGLRPGEKLFEELLADSELTRATHHPKLRIAKACDPAQEWLPELIAWLEETPVCDEITVRTRLKSWLPEYQPYSS